MEPGPTERHESDTAAATTPADGTGTVGVPPADAADAANDAVPPRPRTRRGWMSDSPLDGGSGWPTSAYAIIPRPANFGSVNGSANATAPHQGTTEPDGTRKSAATQSAAAGDLARPGQVTSTDGTRPPGRFKLPKQKSRQLGTAATRAGSSPAEDTGRDTASDAATSQGATARRAGTQGTAPSQAASGAAPTTELQSAAPAPPTADPRGGHDDPTGTSHRGLAIAGALIFVLAVAIAVFFAVRSAGTDADKTGSASAGDATPNTVLDPTTINDMADPDPSASASFAPGVPGAGDVFRSGSVRLSMVPDQADESFDFDSGTKGAPNTFSAGDRPDVDALTQGLWAANGARIAVWTQTGPPTSAGCRALSSDQWSSLMKLEPVLVGPKACVQTSEGRVAGFVARPIDVGADGGVTTVYLDFTVWKKTGD